MLLTDSEINRLQKEYGILDRFHDRQVSTTAEGSKCVSYGLSSAGYDLRLDAKFKILNVENTIALDPHDSAWSEWLSIEEHHSLKIPAHGFVLGQSYEYIKMPNFLTGIALGKSTYARCAINVNMTPLEPGWQGHLTIEISNMSPTPVWIYPYQGICQLLFFKHDRPNTTYADRKGKYQFQTEPTVAKV